MTDPVFPEGVRGWLTYEEADILARAARGRRRAGGGDLLRQEYPAPRSGLSPVSSPVDTHRGDRNVGVQNTLAEFLTNLELIREALPS
jgi:hypothetical protein